MQLNWYPLRVRYSSDPFLLSLSEQLTEEGCESYVPMRLRKVGQQVKMTPAVSNLIFVRSSHDDLTRLKHSRKDFLQLSWIMTRQLDDKLAEHWEPLVVPDRQMADFVRITSEANDSVVFLDNLDWACRPGATVQITEGPFAGVMGVVKRIKKNLCVVLPIKDVMAVAITNVPRHHLRLVGDDEL